jgi:bromodomain-containing factor 1
VSTVRTLKKLKDAAPFLHPVDPISLGIPHYTTAIKTPMDLGTVEKKLMASHPAKPDLTKARYNTVDEFVKDVKLIFQNCITFNGPDHAISQMGKRLESVFEKQIKQVPPNEEVSLSLDKQPMR